MKMVVVACDHPGCGFGALYVVPADPVWPSYAGSHKAGDGSEHDIVRVLTADYNGDTSDAQAMLDWANAELNAS